MVELGDWSSHENKKYIGKIDRIYGSMTKEYEVEYFIDYYLKNRGFEISNSNRNLVISALEKYSSRTPFKQDDLTGYLDTYFKK